MIKKENLDKTSAWPFVEAKKMLRERKNLIEEKGKITLQTGYGPSGLPHIGTFGEVARTTMMVNALKQLTDIPTEIIQNSTKEILFLSKKFKESIIRNLDNYLYNEIDALPSDFEINSFDKRLSNLEINVDRVEAKMNKLKK